jgi:transposase
MARSKRKIIGGVDTHQRTHHAAILDHNGALLGDAQFPVNAGGYAALLAWMRQHGQLVKVGVEGTGTYGAGLTRYLVEHDVIVVEVDRPDRKTRRTAGKSDPIDAISAARAALAGTAAGIPKTRTGPVEAIRALRVARRGAMKARTAALNQMRGLVTAAPEELRQLLHGRSVPALISACAKLIHDPERLDQPLEATKAALALIAGRAKALGAEATTLEKQLARLVAATAPKTSALFGVGPDVAAQLLTTAGDNPDRLRSEAALAHLCGAAPIPASSGNTHRHRLHRGGDRGANHALHTIVLCRLRYDPRTRAYMRRRTAQGLTPKDIIRCLKRYIAREVHAALIADFTNLNTGHP